MASISDKALPFAGQGGPGTFGSLLRSGIGRDTSLTGTVRTLLFDRVAASAYTVSSHRVHRGFGRRSWLSGKNGQRRNRKSGQEERVEHRTPRSPRKEEQQSGLLGRAKPKSATKNAARKKQQRMKSLETVVVDVIEEPAPGVITITEFEEKVPSRGWVGTKGDRED
jgi:hypothetical protein